MRGTPVLIDLGFDPSEDFHRYAIEWDPNGMRWFVDRELVFARAEKEIKCRASVPKEFFFARVSMAFDALNSRTWRASVRTREPGLSALMPPFNHATWNTRLPVFI
jgi:beta-glucanase (GH16 family)